MFLNYAEFGRADLLCRQPHLRALLLSRDYSMVVAAVQCRYRRQITCGHRSYCLPQSTALQTPCRLWQRVTIRTRVVMWDDAWIWMESRIYTDDPAQVRLMPRPGPANCLRQTARFFWCRLQPVCVVLSRVAVVSRQTWRRTSPTAAFADVHGPRWTWSPPPEPVRDDVAQGRECICRRHQSCTEVITCSIW